MIFYKIKNSLTAFIKTPFIKFLFMSCSYQTEKFVALVAQEVNQKEKKILDIGAGEKPFQKYFSKAKYFSQDVKQNKEKNIDFVGDINQDLKMIKKESFDYILCTQVLEHIKKPQKAFEEFYRILKPGGKVFLTTNFIYQIHSAPYDYYRFTRFGLEYLGKDNGFKIEHLKAQGGAFHVCSYLIFNLPIRIIFKKTSIFYLFYIILFSPLIAFFNLAAFFLDRLDKKRELTINYEVIYKKKG